MSLYLRGRDRRLSSGRLLPVVVICGSEDRAFLFMWEVIRAQHTTTLGKWQGAWQTDLLSPDGWQYPGTGHTYPVFLCLEGPYLAVGRWGNQWGAAAVRSGLQVALIRKDWSLSWLVVLEGGGSIRSLLQVLWPYISFAVRISKWAGLLSPGCLLPPVVFGRPLLRAGSTLRIPTKAEARSSPGLCVSDGDLIAWAVTAVSHGLY